MKNEEEKISNLLPQIFEHINTIVRSAAKDVMQQLLNVKYPQEPSRDEDFLSAEQAASFLKLKLGTIYSKVENGDLPHYRVGKRKLLFSKKELEQYVAKRKVKSIDEINAEVQTFDNKKSWKSL